MFQSGMYVRPEDRQAYNDAARAEAAALQDAVPNNSGYTYTDPINQDGTINPWIAKDNQTANGMISPSTTQFHTNLMLSKIADDFLDREIKDALNKSHKKIKKSGKKAYDDIEDA